MILNFDSQANGFLIEVKKRSDLFYQLVKKKSFELLEDKKRFVIGFIETEDSEFEFNKEV